MKLRWSFRAANDRSRAVRGKSRFPQGVPEQHYIRSAVYFFQQIELPTILCYNLVITKNFKEVIL